MQGFDITPDLRRMCPSLTLQQIYKLSEHHHDDWITAVGDNQGTKTIVLLETLKRAVDSSGGFSTPPPASPMRSTDGGPQTPMGYPSPASVSSRHSGFEDEDNLLLDSQVGAQVANGHDFCFVTAQQLTPQLAWLLRILHSSHQHTHMCCKEICRLLVFQCTEA